MAKFDDPQKVRSTLTASDDVERVRAINRSTINRAMNGEPPLTSAEAIKANLRVNVNFGEMPSLAAQGRRQYFSGFFEPENFFTIKLPSAPPQKKSTWELLLTRGINRPMKASRLYFHLKQNQFASLVAHGIAPQLWESEMKWLPSFIALEDIRVPTDTETSLKNLYHFGVRKYYYPLELAEKARFDKRDSRGWNRKYIQAILSADAYKDASVSNSDWNWADNPEKMYEIWKQNGGYYMSDAVPTIPVWHFYFLDDDDQWKLRAVCDTGVENADENEFLYDSDEPIADDLAQFMHVQFGDLNAKAPFMWHSVRSLGFLLLEPAFFSNLLDCRLLQHTLEHMNAWLRSTDPAGKAKAAKAEFFDRCIVPEGITFVTQQERPQIDPNLVETCKARMRQYMAESTSAYTQKTDAGTQREQTAFETRVKLQQANAMLGAILSIAFYQEKFAYMEICRRFCLVNSSDSDVRKFQREMKSAGIPKQYLNVDLWDVKPEVPLGAGNPTLQQAVAQQLMEVRDKFAPAAQQKILHLFTEAITGDADLAQDLAPIEDRMDVTDAQETATLAFGTLMEGVPVRLRENHSPQEVAEELLGLLAGKIANTERSGNMSNMDQLRGMYNVASFIGQEIQVLSLNPENKPIVKGLSDQLGGLMNALKGFAQRLQEQQGQNAMSPEANGKVQERLMLASTNAKIKDDAAQQKLLHKEVAFSGDQRRKDAQTIAEIGREHAKAETKNRLAPTNGE